MNRNNCVTFVLFVYLICRFKSVFWQNPISLLCSQLFIETYCTRFFQEDVRAANNLNTWLLWTFNLFSFHLKDYCRCHCNTLCVILYTNFQKNILITNLPNTKQKILESIFKWKVNTFCWCSWMVLRLYTRKTSCSVCFFFISNIIAS